MHNFWEHTLTLYIPRKITQNQALLFVGDLRSAKLDFVNIANQISAITIHLENVPNQPLAFEDGKSRKEDDLVAYTWNRIHG